MDFNKKKFKFMRHLAEYIWSSGRSQCGFKLSALNNDNGQICRHPRCVGMCVGVGWGHYRGMKKVSKIEKLTGEQGLKNITEQRLFHKKNKKTKILSFGIHKDTKKI